MSETVQTPLISNGSTQQASALVPFHCRGCKGVVAYTNGVVLKMGEAEFILPVTFIHTRAGCGYKNRWYPAGK